MSHPLIRSCENYVVLEPGKPEKFLSEKETEIWLIKWLEQLNELPYDLEVYPAIKHAAKHLLNTACELEIKPGFNLQWFAVRLEHPDQ